LQPDLDPAPTADLTYLLELGIPVENIATRIGRTPTAVRHLIREEQERIENHA
jgi:predicted transcriptional regulator